MARFICKNCGTQAEGTLTRDHNGEYNTSKLKCPSCGQRALEFLAPSQPNQIKPNDPYTKCKACNNSRRNASNKLICDAYFNFELRPGGCKKFVPKQ